MQGQGFQVQGLGLDGFPNIGGPFNGVGSL